MKFFEHEIEILLGYDILVTLNVGFTYKEPSEVNIVCINLIGAKGTTWEKTTHELSVGDWLASLHALAWREVLQLDLYDELRNPCLRYSYTAH